MTQDEIIQRLTPLIHEITAVPEERITPESSLFHDLGAESLDLLDLSFLIEEEFGVQLAANDLERRIRSSLPDDSAFEVNGILTPEALAELKRLLPEVPENAYPENLAHVAIPSIFNVAAFARLIAYKLEEV